MINGHTIPLISLKLQHIQYGMLDIKTNKNASILLKQLHFGQLALAMLKTMILIIVFFFEINNVNVEFFCFLLEEHVLYGTAYLVSIT